MKILDRYLIKQFSQTILFALLVFMTIFVVIDLMEKMDDFIDHNVPFEYIIKYYIVFIPDILKLMLPVAVLLACLFTVGKMSTQNELAAIKSSGVSFYRYMMPFLFVAFVISILAIYFGGYVVPIANKEKIYIERVYMEKGGSDNDNNVFFQDDTTRIVTIAFYNTKLNSASRISIQKFDIDNINHMTSRIDAPKMLYDTVSTTWNIIDGIKRDFTDSGEVYLNFDTLNVAYLNFSPNDIIRKQQKPSELTLPELKIFAADLARSGNNPIAILIEYHSRFAFGFACIVVILFGLPLSANNRKGGLALQFGLNLAITFLYLVFMKVSQALGKNGSVSPVITAWLANGIFLAAAILNIIRARK
ncbi:MAG: LptF/LptG family permease [Melioribacteraceae bacterium]|nr:LptF/LptG family permease [Melioribacteraceae bacterium]